MALCPGDVYHSNALGSTGSRSLRETEFHGRARSLGCAFDAPITWLQIPQWFEAGDEDATTLIGEFPVLLPSSLVSWLGWSPCGYCVAYTEDLPRFLCPDAPKPLPKAACMIDDGYMEFLGPVGTEVVSAYWRAFLLDNPGHPLGKFDKERLAHTLPIVLYGDEGTTGQNSFMLGTWILVSLANVCILFEHDLGSQFLAATK